MSTQVIISTYERADHLLKCIQALRAQTIKDFDIIVADDGGNDETYEYIKNMDLTYVRQPHRDFGLAKLRNKGMRVLGIHDINIFIDSDILLNPKAIESYINIYRRNPNRAIGGYYKYLPGMRFTVGDVSRRWDDVWNERFEKEYIPSNVAQPDVRVCWWEMGRLGENVFLDEDKLNPHPFMLLGGNLMIPGHILKQVEWDEGFTMYGGEDGEMSVQIAELGYSFSYSERVAGAHQAHSKNKNATADGEARCIQYIAQKHPRFFVNGEPAWDKPNFRWPERKI